MTEAANEWMNETNLSFNLWRKTAVLRPSQTSLKVWLLNKSSSLRLEDLTGVLGPLHRSLSHGNFISVQTCIKKAPSQ